MSRLTLVAIEMFEVGNAPPPVRREMDLNPTASGQRHFREIADAVEEMGTDYFKTNEARRTFRDISNYSSQGYKPTISVGDDSSSFRTLRDSRDIYRFVAVFEQENDSLRSATHLRIVVDGYTDRVGLDRDDLPDLDTRLHINSISTLRGTRGRFGGTRYASVDNSYVILPNRVGSRGITESISSPSSLLQYADQFEDDESLPSNSVTIESLGLKTRTVQRGVCTPDKYMSTVAESTFIGIETSHQYGGDDFYDSGQLRPGTLGMDHISNNNIELSGGNNKFTGALIDAITNNDGDGEEASMRFRRNNSFLLRDVLFACDVRESEMRDIVIVNRSNNLDYDSENWEGADPETMACYDICHRVPDIALRCLIKDVSFMVSNRSTLGSADRCGKVEVEFSFIGDINDRGGDSYNIIPISGTGEIDEGLLDRFEREIIENVFLPLSDYNNFELDIVVYCSLGGLTHIKILDESGYEVPYFFQSFMASRMNLCLTDFSNGSFDNNIRTFSDLRMDLNSSAVIRATRNHGDAIDDDLPPSRLSDSVDGFFSKRREESSPLLGLSSNKTGGGFGSRRR